MVSLQIRTYTRTKKKMRIKLIGADWLIIITILLMLSNHSITQFLIAKSTTDEQTQREVNALLTYVEANPLAAWLLRFKKLSFIYSYFFAPSVFIGFYYYLRRKYWYQQDLIYMVAIMVFSMLLINFVNDVSVLLGFLLR